MKRKPFKIDENTRFEHLDNGYDVVRNSDDKVSEDTLKVTESEDNLNLDEVDTTTSFKNDIKDGKKFKLSKKLIVGGVAAVVVIGIIAGATSCASSNNKNNEEKDDENNITTEDTTENEVTTTLEEVVVTTEPEQTTIDENEDLKEFANSISKEEFVNLLKTAKNEFEGTPITIEELASFVFTINKASISKDLEDVLISTGVISSDETINDSRYLDACDKIANAMYSEKIYKYLSTIDPEHAKEMERVAQSIHVSNIVWENSYEYEMYKVLDKAYDEIGTGSFEDSMEAYKKVWEYRTTQDGNNFTSLMSTNIVKDLYNPVFDAVTLVLYNDTVTDKNYEFVSKDIEYSQNCSNQKTLS